MRTNPLNKPYPFIESPVIRTSIAGVIGVVLFLLLNTYRPFGIEQVPKSEIAYIAGYGLITFICILTSQFTFSKLVDIQKWTITSEALLHTFNWLLTSILSWVYNNNVKIDIAPTYNLSEFMFIVAATYLVPLLVMIILTEKYFKYLNEQAALSLQVDINESISQSPSVGNTLLINPGTTKSPSIGMETDQFLFAAAEGNYVMVHYLDDEGKITKQLIRLTLKNLVRQLKDHKEIIQCHKSYLVNRDHIKEVEGNARALYIHLTSSDLRVPISRSFDRSLLG